MVHRGREVSHQELGHTLLDKVQELVKDIAVIEQMPRREGWMISMTAGPITEKMRREMKKQDEEPADSPEPSTESEPEQG